FFVQVRPTIEWTFKFVGWVVAVSTIQYAYEKTSLELLLYLRWFLYVLLYVFVYAFSEWLLAFRIVTGQREYRISIVDLASLTKTQRLKLKVQSYLREFRRWLALLVSLLVTFVI